MPVQPGSLAIVLPAWLERFWAAAPACLASAEERMGMVVDAARRNVELGTGGPFAAAVFEAETGRLVSLGVNLVTSENLSILHAEIVALSLAQRQLGTYDLGAAGLPAYELVSSTEPCAMCLGAIPWSGIRSLVVGARDADARRLGFDEGAKPPAWIRALECRGIRVRRDVRRREAAGVLKAYVEGGGRIYNGRMAPP